MKKIHLPFFVLLLFLYGCKTAAYYMSPLNATANYYQTVPLRSDSEKVANYVAAVLTAGGSNYFLRDGVAVFQGNFHQARNFGHFQAFYGAGIALGSYHVKEYYITNESFFRLGPPTDTLLHIPGNSQFLGSCGFNGAINYVLSSKNGRFECRVGFETSIQHESGSYLSFRKSLPDTAINILETSSWTKTLGTYFDFNWKSRKGVITGYKIASGSSLISHATYKGSESQFAPGYITQTLHVTKDLATYFMQFYLGSYAAGVNFGINYKLGKHS